MNKLLGEQVAWYSPTNVSLYYCAWRRTLHQNATHVFPKIYWKNCPTRLIKAVTVIVSDPFPLELKVRFVSCLSDQQHQRHYFGWYPRYRFYSVYFFFICVVFFHESKEIMDSFSFMKPMDLINMFQLSCKSTVVLCVGLGKDLFKTIQLQLT